MHLHMYYNVTSHMTFGLHAVFGCHFTNYNKNIFMYAKFIVQPKCSSLHLRVRVCNSQIKIEPTLYINETNEIPSMHRYAWAMHSKYTHTHSHTLMVCENECNRNDRLDLKKRCAAKQ